MRPPSRARQGEAARRKLLSSLQPSDLAQAWCVCGSLIALWRFGGAAILSLPLLASHKSCASSHLHVSLHGLHDRRTVERAVRSDAGRGRETLRLASPTDRDRACTAHTPLAGTSSAGTAAQDSTHPPRQADRRYKRSGRFVADLRRPHSVRQQLEPLAASPRLFHTVRPTRNSRAMTPANPLQPPVAYFSFRHDHSFRQAYRPQAAQGCPARVPLCRCVHLRA